jgi:hypothetical protein
VVVVFTIVVPSGFSVVVVPHWLGLVVVASQGTVVVVTAAVVVVPHWPVVVVVASQGRVVVVGAVVVVFTTVVAVAQPV